MKKNFLFILTSLSAITLVLFLAYRSATPLNEYIPKNKEETEIIDLLTKFQKAKQYNDLEEYLSCLDEHGQYMFSGHLMVGKSELSALLPDFWKRLKENDAHVKPMCRENLNGNFFDGSFFNPIISIYNDKAHVTLTFQTPVIRWRTLFFLQLIRKNNSWFISRYEWDMG